MSAPELCPSYTSRDHGYRGLCRNCGNPWGDHLEGRPVRKTAPALTIHIERGSASALVCEDGEVTGRRFVTRRALVAWLEENVPPYWSGLRAEVADVVNATASPA